VRSLGRRDFLKFTALGSIAMGTSTCVLAPRQTAAVHTPPNIVIIFLDDSGWADFRPFAIPPYGTPHVKKLADEGCTFTNFIVPQAVCSASRAALLSGCYPGRTKVFGAHYPGGAGLDPKFAIMPEVFKTRGYKTAVFGKWHIGDKEGRRPWDRGFDESCGLLYSNDMWEFNPDSGDQFAESPLQFWENGEVAIEYVTPDHQPMLTTWYTEHAVDFIERNSESPFFLYVPHSMPHVPLFCSDKFNGKSGAGLYGDVMMEIDWSVGQITAALKASGVEDNTIVIFTSDNGPWTVYGNHSGKTPYREAKATGFDGGIRSACIIKYPGKIAAGTSSDRLFCTIDLMPTLAGLTGSSLPENPVDGKDVWPLITGSNRAGNPHKYYPFSTGNHLDGVISGDGKWKLHLPHGYRTLVEPGNDGARGTYRQERIGLSLFDMENDPYETTDVKEQHPDVLRRLKRYADAHKKTFYSRGKR